MSAQPERRSRAHSLFHVCRYSGGPFWTDLTENERVSWRRAAGELFKVREEALVLCALALTAGEQTDSTAGDAIPQEVWERLFSEGWVRLSEAVPGADRVAVITPQGSARLADGARGLAQ